MNKPSPKTLDEHLEYLYELVRLKLFFMWHWLRKHPDEDVVHVLHERVDIYRKTDINDGTMNPRTLHYDNPVWAVLEEKLAKLHAGHRDDDDASAFEHAGFVLFKPRIDGRAKTDFAERRYVRDYNCGSLKYDPPRPEQPGRVMFHIANALQPASIFDNPAYLPGCLRELMQKSSAEHGATELGTFTWLNAYPRWQALFPDAWNIVNRSPADPDVKWHYGYWGQFVTARGTFNYAYGERMRAAEGELPYLPFYSWCTFEELRRHLKKGNG